MMARFDFYILQVIEGWNIFIFLFTLVCVMLWQRSQRPADFPPGPLPFPIVGNLANVFVGDLLKSTRRLSKTYGSIFSLSLGPYWAIFVNDAKSLHEVFVKHSDKFSERPDVFFINTLLDKKGIVSSSGHLWKQQRTFSLIALRHFRFGKKSLETKIIQESEFLLRTLQDPKTKSVYLENDIRKAVSNVTCSVVFGKRFSYDDKKFLRLTQMVHNMLANPFLPIVNWIPYLHKVGRVFDIFGTENCLNLVKEFKREMALVIEQHKQNLNESEPRNFIDAYLIEWKMCDKNEKQFTEDNLEAVLLELFAAGTDTTAVAILWTILFLVNNPKVQEKMHEEMLQTVGQGISPLLQNQQDLPYCVAVLYEAHRLGNIAPFSIPHSTQHDVIIGKYRIPKGSVVVPHLNAAMFDENVFTNPEEFNPERFLNKIGRINGLHQYVLPFSLGM